MKKYNTKLLTEKLQQQTGVLLDKAVQEWQMMSPAKFAEQPAAGEWSAMQCLDHLNMYGDYYLPAIEKVINDAKQQLQQPAIVFKPGILGNYFTNMMRPGDDGRPAKKIKAFKNYNPTANSDSDVVIAKFIEQQEKLLALLDESKLIDLNKCRVPVSIAPYIKLKLGDVFMFLIAHNYRHVLQAERSLQHAGITATKKKTLPLQYFTAMFF
ncbi:MAG TPA: DinB family protein [Panacibacter sp.]|nr:DinB family protein [Panacibacter sp.]HNP46259.1 DinB family protein [Panacibacter sp.]